MDVFASRSLVCKPACKQYITKKSRNIISTNHTSLLGGIETIDLSGNKSTNLNAIEKGLGGIE